MIITGELFVIAGDSSLEKLHLAEQYQQISESVSFLLTLLVNPCSVRRLVFNFVFTFKKVSVYYAPDLGV